MAERVGDRHAVVAALRARQFARSGPDGATDRLALGDRMLELGKDGDDEARLWGRLWRFDALLQLGDLDRAEAELRPIAEVADRLRSPLARWHELRSRAAVAQGRGRFAHAEALGGEAAAIARRAGHPGTPELAWGFPIALAIQTGNVDQFPEGSPDVGVWPTAVARWHLALDRRAQAQQVFRTLQMRGPLQRYGLLTELAGRAELAAEFDDRESAADVYRRLVPFAELFVSGGAGAVAVLGSVRLPLGQAAATLGRLDDAVRHLRAAVVANERAGLPPFTASSRYWLARVLARRQRPGDRSEAAALAALAAASAETLGMAPLRRDAHRLATELEDGPPGRLTRREQEIAVLVSQGLTNRQIAATAHISERTAESHVQHILDKLGFSNRSQIAAWVAAAEVGTDGQ
jgi:DNA-binding CsgD family transcriptional regulator